MGGTTALDVALQDEALRTTFLLGIAGVATPTSPQNLFLGSGIYEELNPVGVMEEFWALAIAPDAVSADDSDAPHPSQTHPFQTHPSRTHSFQTVRQAGHPAAARRLVFSPTADHFLAPYDQTLIREVTDWVAQSLGLLDLVSDRSGLRHSGHLGWRLLGQVSTGASLLGLLTYGYSRIYRYARSRGWLLGGMVTIAAIAVLLLTDSVPWSNGGLLALVMILGVGNYCCRDDFHRHCSFAAKVRLSMLYLGLIYLVFMVAVGVHALIAGSLLAYPQAIAYFPHLVLTLPVPLIYDRVQWLRYSLNSSMGIGIVGSIIAIEMMRPGWVLFGVGKGFKKGLTFSRQPWTWQLTSTSTAQSRQTLILAGLLLLVLAIALGYQYQAGILTWEATQVVLKLALGFIVLPTVLLIGIVRSPLFRAIETAVKQSSGSHGSQSRPHGF